VEILMVMDVPGGTTEQYDRVLELLPAGRPPGLVSHVCAPSDRGLLVVDVWETQEALDAFFVTGGFGAALKQAGINEVQPRIYAVHDRSRYLRSVITLSISP
jgi:hypothetical protein